MNIFEKYIENVKQNKELTEIINDLCQIHLIHCAPVLEEIYRHKFIKFLRWELDVDMCPPTMIKIFYLGEDLETKKQDECYKSIEYNNLLMKLDNYD